MQLMRKVSNRVEKARNWPHACRYQRARLRPCKFFKTKTKTFDFFQDQNQDFKNGMRINSLSLMAIFLLEQKTFFFIERIKAGFPKILVPQTHFCESSLPRTPLLSCVNFSPNSYRSIKCNTKTQ